MKHKEQAIPTQGQRQVAAGVFKATCLSLLDEVARTGQSLIVTKRGRPVVRISAATETGPKSLLGSVSFGPNVLAPIDVEWKVEK